MFFTNFSWSDWVRWFYVPVPVPLSDWRWDYVCGEKRRGEREQEAKEKKLRNPELRALLETALKLLARIMREG